MYVTSDAAQNWECELGGYLEEIGLRRGQASTCLYSEEVRGISASVHGDDVTVKASREDAEWLIKEFKKRYEIKRHVKEVIKALGLEGASPAPHARSSSQGRDQGRRHKGSVDAELGHEETTMFRAVAARLNYLTQDRPDITFATMKLCSKMSRPDAQDLKNMKRVGRFLVGRPRVGCLFEWQAHPSALHALAQTIKKVGQRRHDPARETLDQGLDEAAKHCGYQHRRSRTVRWQPCSNRVDGSSGVCQRLG